ncbi:hypothetical protein ABZQ74_06600 [Pseudomonas aeruginosa]|uniref:hypothetical protein n=1 Tax=Pseudomonas aeruginosa group TaxID=136841 RepID=UPI000A54F782|nr:hypothetical protein [Pseudomonas aeruginosa]EIU4337593.1 hypothetical protein [Pseudomonas aeruginosa]EIU4463304.1 hypothetical protein [Pseudomonas aeruginosa]EIY9708115.1 hypothetical protein [Pseudomonas aeruginosa]EKU9485582.1 hypothetical protein [Pseudomonas aeruginosa]EKU9634830.1 hypothetical protein [Pseudomonas aeruginosa]
MKTRDIASADDWHIESDLSTMLEAKKIAKDPKRMAAVRKLAAKKQADLQALSEKSKQS